MRRVRHQAQPNLRLAEDPVRPRRDGLPAGRRPPRPARLSAQEEKIARLENKLQQKNEVISELMEENVREKNPLGNSERTLGSPRHPRRSGRLRAAVGTSARRFPRGSSSAGWASRRASSTTGEDRYGKVTNTTPGFRGLVAGGLGEASHHPLLLRVSAGGLPAAGVHDARPRRGGRQPVERLSRVEGGGPDRPLDRTSRRRKARAFISRKNPMNTGISTSATSTSTARFTTSRRSSTATAATSCIGRFAAR